MGRGQQRDTTPDGDAYLKTWNTGATEFEKAKIHADWATKEEKANALVEDFLKRAGDVKGKKLLELGFGSGLHIPAFVRAGAEVYGLEIEGILLETALSNLNARGVHAHLLTYDGKSMPYANDFFDYVCATSVLEHVSDFETVLSEADRVLKPGGRFYISFPNRWSPRETHTGFWFVHYLPRRVAEQLMIFFGSNAVRGLNLHFISYLDLRKAIKKTHFRILLETDARTMTRRIFKKLLAALGIHHSAVLKTVMVVLEKHV